MTKSNRKPAHGNIAEKRPIWLVPGIILGLIVLVLGALALILGTRREPFEPRVAGEPRAEIDQTNIDLGSFAFNAPVEGVFKVRNVGDQPLHILGEPRVELVEGC